jgi:hypothetical protein
MLEKGELAIITGLFADQIGFGLVAAVAADMFDSHPMVLKDAPDQEAAVAGGRILFAAQEGHAELAEALLQACQAFLKEWRLGHTIVEHMSFAIVEFGAGGPSAQFASHMEVADVVCD